MEYTAKRQQCQIQAPKGLHLVTSEGTLTATLGSNVTFLVFLEEVRESNFTGNTIDSLTFSDHHQPLRGDVSFMLSFAFTSEAPLVWICPS